MLLKFLFLFLFITIPFNSFSSITNTTCLTPQTSITVLNTETSENFINQISGSISKKLLNSVQIDDILPDIFSDILKLLGLDTIQENSKSKQLLKKLILLQRIIISINNDLLKAPKGTTITKNPIFQEIMVLSSYLGEMEVISDIQPDADLKSAIKGNSAPDHMFRIIEYFIKKSKNTDIFSSFLKILSKEAVSFSNIETFQSNTYKSFPPLEPGGAICQVYLASLSENTREGIRPPERLKKLISDKVNNEGISAIWLMPIQFFRGWGKVKSPYARSANSLHWDLLTPQETKDIIEHASKLGVTIYFDTVLNHTGRDSVLGIKSGPYPDECYVKNNEEHTVSWEGLLDTNAELDTMKLDYDNRETWQWAYQELASRLRRLGWDSESKVKVGFRLDVAGFVNHDFWRWALDNFRKEFGAVPPIMAEWGDFEQVEYMFGKNGATYDEKLREELIHVANNNDSGFGRLPDMFHRFNQLWEYLFYIVYGNHDEHQHAMNHHKTGEILEKNGIPKEIVPYPLGVLGVHDEFINFNKLQVYIALNFLGFPPNAIPSHFAGDETITKTIKFLENKPLGALNLNETHQSLKKLLSKTLLSPSEKVIFHFKAEETYWFFKEILKLRQLIFREQSPIIDSSLLKADDNVWIVKFKQQDETEYVTMINKNPPSNIHEKFNSRELKEININTIKTTLNPWQIKIFKLSESTQECIFDNQKDGSANVKLAA